MKERPILFNAEMVRAILDSRKTQTRRVLKMKDQPPSGYSLGASERYNPNGINRLVSFYFYTNDDENPYWPKYTNDIWCPYGQIDDQLWVRETFSIPSDVARLKEYTAYKATECIEQGAIKWTPSIHMPRWASRIQLEITNVRVERLQDISEEDAIAEGITYAQLPNNIQDAERAKTWYRGLWATINGYESWQANPYVWVIEFKKIN